MDVLQIFNECTTWAHYPLHRWILEKLATCYVVLTKVSMFLTFVSQMQISCVAVHGDF